MITEIIITTFQKPRHLATVLQSLLKQHCLPNIICVADDGSDYNTENVIQNFRFANPSLNIRHIWHENLGFRKTRILNDAVHSSQADYIIFTDDDCVMHPTFISRHLKLAKEGHFATGSAIRLTKFLSDKILDQGELSWSELGRPLEWQPRSFSEKLKSMPFDHRVMGILDYLSPVRCSWAGGNASTFRKHILKVNGFDTKMAYGGEDKEFGVRLTNLGIKGRHLRYTAPIYHLHHELGYVKKNQLQKNREILKQTRSSNKIVTENGIFPM